MLCIENETFCILVDVYYICKSYNFDNFNDANTVILSLNVFVKLATKISYIRFCCVYLTRVSVGSLH